MEYKNKERSAANLCLFVMFGGILATVLPFFFQVDLISWGFGVAFIGLLVAISSFLVFLMFNGRAKVQEKIFKQENILAHWRYSKEFWQEHYQDDLVEAGMGKVFGLFFGGIFSLLGIGIFLLDTAENKLFLLIMLGLAVFFVLIGLLSAGLEKHRVESTLPEAIITKEGLFFKNILYTWNAKAIAYLESVSLHPELPASLLFVLRQLSGGNLSMAHYHKFMLPVPIPLGEEAQALKIIAYFKLQNQLEDEAEN